MRDWERGLWNKKGGEQSGEKEGTEGWRRRKEHEHGGVCSTCDGWALAQVWRRDQIKSLSRQQWTRDKVITFASLPLLPPPPLSVYLPQCESLCPRFKIIVSRLLCSQPGGGIGLHLWVMLDTFQSCTLGAGWMTSAGSTGSAFPTRSFRDWSKTIIKIYDKNTLGLSMCDVMKCLVWGFFFVAYVSEDLQKICFLLWENRVPVQRHYRILLYHWGWIELTSPNFTFKVTLCSFSVILR